MTTNRSSGPWVVFVALTLCATLAGPTHADLGPLEVVYLQSFENGHDGWTLDPFTRYDDARIIPDPMEEPGGDAAADPPNHVVMACATRPESHCGFRVESPSFDSMGLNVHDPYTISFRYGLYEPPACWTYALASTHVSLVVVECNEGFATLAFVDELSEKVERVGRVPLGQWNDVEVVVMPDADLVGANVVVRINGQTRGIYHRDHDSTFDAVVFMDLPYRYVNATETDGIPTETAFGGGVWDDVVIRRENKSGGPGPRGIVPRVEPNPFNPRTVLSFALDREASVRIDLFDVSGRRVRSLFDGRLPAGPQALPWDGRDDARADVASGVYLVRTVVDGVTSVTRATVVR